MQIRRRCSELLVQWAVLRPPLEPPAGVEAEPVGANQQVHLDQGRWPRARPGGAAHSKSPGWAALARVGLGGTLEAEASLGRNLPVKQEAKALAALAAPSH